MNAKILFIIALLACGPAVADVPEGQTLGTLSWNFSSGEGGGVMNPGGIPATSVLHPGLEFPAIPLDRSNPSDLNRYNQAVAMRIDYSGEGELQLKLYSVPGGDPPWMLQKLTTHNYALVGEVKYENVPSGSYLQMLSFFPPVEVGEPTAYPSFEVGSTGGLDGTHDWREFRLSFDGTGMTKKLAQLEMNLHLTGPGTVHLRNMRLVQYPDGPLPATQATATQTPVVVAAESHGIDWKSFFLGVAATGVFLLAGGGIIFISRRWNRRRHEREMRRIASLDS